MIEDLENKLDYIKANDIYPDINTIEGPSTNPEVIANGKKVLMFSSNNYLGLAGDESVKEAVINAVRLYGMGSGGSRLISGNIVIQKRLEKAIADFKGAQDAMLFSTGYMANVGLIPSLMKTLHLSTGSYLKEKLLKSRSVVFGDELNHASIVDGCTLAKAERFSCDRSIFR